MRFVLVRHPRPLIEPGICYGRTDLPLHPEALAGLERLAADPAFAGIKHVWTSPARRCAVLAEAIAERMSLPISSDPRLLELDFGSWEGRAWNDVPRADLDDWAADPPGFRAHGGESASQLVARVQTFHAALIHAGRDCAVISHGGPLKVLLALLRGEPVDLLATPPPLGSVMVVNSKGPPP